MHKTNTLLESARPRSPGHDRNRGDTIPRFGCAPSFAAAIPAQPEPQTEFLRGAAGGGKIVGWFWSRCATPWLANFTTVFFRRSMPQITNPGGVILRKQLLKGSSRDRREDFGKARFRRAAAPARLNALRISGRQDWRVRMKPLSRRANVATRHRVLAAVLFIRLDGLRVLRLRTSRRSHDPANNGSKPELVVSLGGKVKHPQQLDLNALQRLPTDQVTVSYQAGHGVEEASFTGVPLWTLLAEAGGIDDPANRAELRHVIRITARDGYVVVLSPGEIAPDFGAKQALLAYRRNDEAPAAAGFRLVMPGDKHGGRYVLQPLGVNFLRGPQDNVDGKE
jgi:hypothetical protein